MARFLFWNLGGRSVEGLVAKLAHEHSVDVLILAETVDMVTLLRALNSDNGSATYSPGPRSSKRLVILTRLPPESLKEVADEAGVVIRSLRPPIGFEILIVAVHLPSKLHYKDIDQTIISTRLAETIANAEERIGHQRTVVVGDLNMNPFEPGVVAHGALHAVANRPVAARGSRVVAGRSQQFFYNPMWNFFGDKPPRPPGTYYYRSSKPLCYFWNIFDQVLVRPSLMDYLPEERLKVVSEVGSRTQLLDEAGRPDSSVGSDHLPILFDINVEKGL